MTRPTEGPEVAGLTHRDRFVIPREMAATQEVGMVAITVSVADDKGEQTFGTALHRPTEDQTRVAVRVLADRAQAWLRERRS